MPAISCILAGQNLQKMMLTIPRGNDFAYDANGNMIKDLDRDIVTIRYYLLNLPDTIQFRNGSRIVNLYKEYILTTPRYDLFSLKRVHNSEGYMNKEYQMHEGFARETSRSFNYYRRDHLGNNREVWQAPHPGGGGAGITIQRTQYYPSGLPLPYQDGDGADVQPYKHGGKEFIETHGYDVTDHGNRGLYHAINRYTTIDRFAEKTPWQSPYVHAANNPVNYVDINGDSVRVYTETQGTGHAWISVGEGDDMVVYSYGRYNGTNKGPDGSSNSLADGPGVLLKLTGEEAKAYNEEKSALEMSVYVVTDVADETIATAMDGMFNSSTTAPDKGKYKDNPSARVIDEYILTSNNCTTVVSDVLNNSGSSALKGSRYQQTSTFGTWTIVPVINRFVLPASIQNHLNRTSKPEGTVYRTR